MDISDGEDELASDILVLVALRGVGEGGTVKVEPQDVENNNNATVNIEEDNAGECAPDAVQRPSIEGLHVHTPRRNALSSSIQSINFPELVRFMLMHAEAENQMEQRHQEGREEMEDMHHHEQKEAEERNMSQR